jgi:hypothetical protein
MCKGGCGGGDKEYNDKTENRDEGDEGEVYEEFGVEELV